MAGPIASSYGEHLVWIRERVAAHTPPLATIRAQVLQQLRAERGEERARSRLREWRREYAIVVADAPQTEPPPRTRRVPARSRCRDRRRFSETENGARDRPRRLAISRHLQRGLGSPRPVDAHPLAPSVLELRETTPGHAEALWKTPLVGVPERASGLSCRTTAERLGLRRSVAPKPRWWRVGRSPASRRPSSPGDRRRGHRREPRRRPRRRHAARRQESARRAHPDHPSFVVPERQRAREVARSYVLLGIEHILTGVDHLLFVLGLLLLVTARRRLVWTLTPSPSGTA